MFETAREDWKNYLTQVSGSWDQSDPRHNLGMEITTRLRQLDLVIRRLKDAIRDVTPEPGETRRNLAWAMSNRERLARGEISGEEYVAGFITTYRTAQELTDAWDSVQIFTEMFYFTAWRVVEVLNRKGTYQFPGLGKINAPEITIVRNHLIEHPEKVKDNPDFTNGLVIHSSGPVLRSLGGVIRGDREGTYPLSESKDQGLYVAGEELEKELHRRFTEALGKTAA
jgi:hypothetical protein